MFSSLKRMTGTALALVMLSSPVFAADITPEGAAALKAMIQTQLDLRKNIQKAAGGEYVTEGDVKVEPAGNFYAVTFPHLKIRDVTGRTFDIGMFAANVIPGATEQEWKASFAIPTPIRILDGDNKVTGQIDIGQQKSVGVWATDANSFTRLDSNFDNIAYKDTAGDVSFTVANFQLRNQFSREANGNLSGPASAVFSNWGIASATDKVRVKMDQVRADVSVKDLDPKIASQFNEQVGAIGQTGQQLTDGAASSSHDLGLYNMITKMITSSADAFGSKISVSGLSVSAPPVGSEPAGTEFTLAQAGLGFDMAGFRSEKVKMGFQLNFDGLNLATTDQSIKDVVPNMLNLNLNFNNLPIKQMIDLGRESISASNAGGDAANMAGMTAMMTLPKLLTDAGTNLTQDFKFATPIFKGMANGVVNADMQALQGFTADQTMELEGLDVLIGKINEELQKPENPNAEGLRNVLGALTVLQLSGQQKPDNPAIRTYKLTVDAQGKMLLNGADMSTFMGGAPAPAPTTATPDAQQPLPAQ